MSERFAEIAANPASIWTFEGENTVFENHLILDTIVSQTFKSVNSAEPAVDSYGYTYSVPGNYTHPLATGNGYATTLATKGQTSIESIDTTDLYGLTLEEREQFFLQNGRKILTKAVFKLTQKNRFILLFQRDWIVRTNRQTAVGEFF
ncbi:MAG: hypothetical protein LBJ67_10260 [Planctomycetaceae bacterium]|nr:hypothetical protein [Planctomycetaceae bacterium]